MLAVNVHPGSSPVSSPVISSNFIMPVDYASYLLSSSPPGFEFHSLRNSFLTDASRRISGLVDIPSNHIITTKLSKSKSDPDARFVTTANSASATPRFCRLGSESECPNLAQMMGKSISQCDLRHYDAAVQQKPNKPLRTGKKRVSFADDMGFRLTTVRIMTEASDTPPFLRPGLLSSLTQGTTASVTENPPLVLGFNQPASDYIAFRQKVDTNNVSLENVILKDYNIMGTVKVKNIAFEKSVKLRVTFDSWQNHKEVSCNYVPGNAGPFDTFSFEINVPTNLDTRKKVEFCVCYSVEGQQFWDSNNGENYTVHPASWQECNTKTSGKGQNIFTLNDDNTTWSEFSSWDHLDSSSPYW